MALAFRFTLDDSEHTVSIAARSPVLRLSVDGREHEVSEASALGDDCALLSVDGRRYEVWRCHDSDRVHLRIGGRTIAVGYEDAITAAQHQAGGDDLLRADMPGVVVSVNCGVGDAVTGGDVLMVIESMKMQINIVAPRDGVIESVACAPEQAFNKGDDLIALQRDDA